MRSPTNRPHEFDLVIVLNYYAPYVSGLTEVARVVAEGCAARGWKVHVVASRHDPALPAHEVINGVSIERTKVVARVRNGVISPSFPIVAWRRARAAKVVNLHLPMLEAGLISIGRSTPVVTTYHCDYVTGEEGPLARIIKQAIDLSSRLALKRSKSVVVTSEDYAQSSRVYTAMRGRETVIPPPFELRMGGTPAFRDSPGMHVGTLGRVVHEKGLDVLIRAFRRLPDPNARLLIAGEHERVAGQSVIEQLKELAADDDRIRFLGYLADADLPDYFASLDALAFPSVNSLEAYGIVQLEAMSAGVPVIASDLPGVRLPVLTTGFGVLVPPGDVAALHAAIRDLPTMHFDRPHIGPSKTTDDYISLFEAVAASDPTG